MTEQSIEELVKSITEWVAANSDRESIFLTANPKWELNSHALLDHISDVSGISKVKIGGWADAALAKSTSKEVDSGQV